MVTDRIELANTAKATVKNTGEYTNGNFHMTVTGDVICVTDTRIAKMVAYSSSAADFDQSLDEFVYDFML